MNKIFCISGPQGSGKTKTLEALMQMPEAAHLSVSTYKVSRSVQAEFGFESLREAVDNLDIMTEFQHGVTGTLNHHLHVLQMIQDSGNPKIDAYLMERSFADVAAYHELWNRRLLGPQESVEAFDAITSNCQQKRVDCTFYLPFMDHVKFEVDPKRGFEADIYEYDNLLRSRLESGKYGSWGWIEGVTPEERARSLLDQINQFMEYADEQ